MTVKQPGLLKIALGMIALHADALPATGLLSAEAARRVPVSEQYAVTPDKVRIYYRTAGQSGPVVIAPFALFHGSALDRLASGRRVVTYDPRGRGKSEAAPRGRLSLDWLLTDLETVRRATGAEKVSIVGWSGAGMETFVYSLRNPSKINRLIQLAPVGPRFVPYGGQMMQDRERRTDLAARDALRKRRAAGAFGGNFAADCRAESAVTNPPLFFDVSKIALIPDVCVNRNEYPQTLGTYFGTLFSSIDGYDWVPSLAKATMPRLVIHATQDNIPLAASEEWVRGQDRARLVVIDRSGHFPLYEQPEPTLRAIADFLDGKWPASAKAVPAR